MYNCITSITIYWWTMNEERRPWSTVDGELSGYCSALRHSWTDIGRPCCATACFTELLCGPPLSSSFPSLSMPLLTSPPHPFLPASLSFNPSSLVRDLARGYGIAVRRLGQSANQNWILEFLAILVTFTRNYWPKLAQVTYSWLLSARCCGDLIVVICWEYWKDEQF